MHDANPAYLRSKLTWRCRRGTKELDVLLSSFLEKHFNSLSDCQQAGFVILLEQQDPIIVDWIWGRLPAPRENCLHEVVDMIRRESGIPSAT